jgi:hypothetical protein
MFQQVLLATENACKLLIEDRPDEGFQRRADVTLEVIGPDEASATDTGVQHAIEIPNDVVDIDHPNLDRLRVVGIVVTGREA